MKDTKYEYLVQAAVERAGQAKRSLRILFVCTGNICRSPLAHAVFDHEVTKHGLEGLFESESAGTHGYHVGDNADPRMRACAKRHGIKLDHAARKLQTADIEYYDLILAMDQEHLDWLNRLDRSQTGSAHIGLYREFDVGSGQGSDVPDPYYGNQDGFEEVWRIVDSCNARLVNALISAMKSKAE